MSVQHQIDLKQLEKKVTALSDALAHLSTPDDWKHLLQILRRPGWTTPAEFAFASGILDGFQGHVAALATMKTQLMHASEAVAAQ